MPNVKHKVTGIVVSATCEQLKNPDYAKLFDVVDEEARCLPCESEDTTVEPDSLKLEEDYLTVKPSFPLGQAYKKNKDKEDV